MKLKLLYEAFPRSDPEETTGLKLSSKEDDLNREEELRQMLNDLSREEELNKTERLELDTPEPEPESWWPKWEKGWGWAVKGEEKPKPKLNPEKKKRQRGPQPKFTDWSGSELLSTRALKSPEEKTEEFELKSTPKKKSKISKILNKKRGKDIKSKTSKRWAK